MVDYGRQRGIGGADDLTTTNLSRSLYLRPKRRMLGPGYDVSYKATVLRDDPGGLWMFDEPSGTSAANSAGGVYTGTYDNSPTLAQGSMIGGLDSSLLTSVSLDGTNDTITIPYDSGLFSYSEFTIEVVVRTPSTLSGSKAIVARDPSTGSNRCFYVVTSGTGLYFSTHNGSSAQVEIGPTTLATSTNYHIACTRGSSTQEVYINGTEVLSGAIVGGAKVSSIGLVFGKYASTYWDGRLQAGAFYPRALTAAQILSHAVAGGFA